MTCGGIQANGTFVNWTNCIQNLSNSTNPIGALTTSVGNALPWFWPFLPFLLYILLQVLFSGSNQKGKFGMLTALAFVISFFMAIFGMVGDAAINIAIFLIAFTIGRLLKL